MYKLPKSRGFEQRDAMRAYDGGLLQLQIRRSRGPIRASRATLLEARAHFPARIRREAVGFIGADVERTHAWALVEIDGRRELQLRFADQDPASERPEIELGRPGEGG